jgi:hypothetical protein
MGGEGGGRYTENLCEPGIENLFCPFPPLSTILNVMMPRIKTVWSKNEVLITLV